MKLTDKRAGIIDRYYIRIYDAYLSKKDPARFAACLYVGLTIGLLLSPIPIFCAELFHTDGGYVYDIILLLYTVSILIWTFGTFNKKRIRYLKAVRNCLNLIRNFLYSESCGFLEVFYGCFHRVSSVT